MFQLQGITAGSRTEMLNKKPDDVNVAAGARGAAINREYVIRESLPQRTLLLAKSLAACWRHFAAVWNRFPARSPPGRAGHLIDEGLSSSSP